MFYETGKRKIQEDRKILAHQIPAGERERAYVCRVVCSGDAGVCVVGNVGLLNLRISGIYPTNFILSSSRKSGHLQVCSAGHLHPVRVASQPAVVWRGCPAMTLGGDAHLLIIYGPGVQVSLDQAAGRATN